MSSDIISKIQKLLAKAESTTHEAEADAFFAKAQELMMAHAISEEALKAAGEKPKDELVEVSVFIKEGLPATKSRQWFLRRVSEAMNCRTLIFGRTNTTHVFGYKSEAEFVQLLYMSVEMQSHAAVLRELKVAKREHAERHPYVKFRPGVWRRTYIEAYLSRVGDRITERYRTVDETHGTGTSIVLRDRGKTAEEWMTSQYIVTNAKQRSRRRDYNWDAYDRGTAAGANADISGGRGHVGQGSRKELGS